MLAEEELKIYKSATVSDAAGNGGRMSNTEVISGAVANLFPVTTQSERTAGALRYRKAFFKVESDIDDVLFSPKLFVDYATVGDDIITFFPGTQIDTQATITGAEDQYGSGQLDAGVLAGATDIDVAVEDGAVILFRDGERIRISDKVDVNSVGGNEEFATIDGVPAVVGDVVTITLAEPLVNGYSEADTRVSSLYEPDNIEATVSDFVVTTAGSGDFDDTELTPHSIGGIEQTWTLTWTGAAAFNIVGDTVGALGAFTNGGGAAPNNPAFGEPYFTLSTAGFSGVWAAADTIVFKTHPAAVPVWIKRVVPAGSAANANNSAIVALKGETA